MKKFAGILTEIVFYVAWIIFTIMKLYDVHFVSKVFGAYMLFAYAAIVFIYYRRIYMLPDSKKKLAIIIITPILILISRSMFVLIGLFALSFSVFKRYDRTKFNVMLKSVYAVFFAICLLTVAYSPVFYSIVFERDDRYEGYEYSPNQEQIVTMIYVGNQERATGFSYRLEDVYFGTFRKVNHEIALMAGRTPEEVIWLSQDEVQINDKIFNIDETTPLE